MQRAPAAPDGRGLAADEVDDVDLPHRASWWRSRSSGDFSFREHVGVLVLVHPMQPIRRSGCARDRNHGHAEHLSAECICRTCQSRGRKPRRSARLRVAADGATQGTARRARQGRSRQLERDHRVLVTVGRAELSEVNPCRLVPERWILASALFLHVRARLSRGPGADDVRIAGTFHARKSVRSLRRWTSRARKESRRPLDGWAHPVSPRRHRVAAGAAQASERR